MIEYNMFIYFTKSIESRCKKLQYNNQTYYWARSIFNYVNTGSIKTCLEFVLNNVDSCNKFTVNQLRLKYNNILLDKNHNYKHFLQFEDEEVYINEQGLQQMLQFLHNKEPEHFKRLLTIKSLPTVMETNN